MINFRVTFKILGTVKKIKSLRNCSGYKVQIKKQIVIFRDLSYTLEYS